VKILEVKNQFYFSITTSTVSHVGSTASSNCENKSKSFWRNVTVISLKNWNRKNST